MPNTIGSKVLYLLYKRKVRPLFSVGGSRAALLLEAVALRARLPPTPLQVLVAVLIYSGLACKGAPDLAYASWQFIPF